MGDSMTLTQADFDTLQNERDLERDAYEARIAELEAELAGAYRGLHKTGTELLDTRAELARVKAESLRVVVDGGPVTAFRLDGNDKFIQVEGDVYYRSGEQFICTNTRIYQGINDDTIVQPVRLERWEMEE